eukprot:CAMPEP_0116843592 /NCGR_PEP_ID=MMETSP0418-20121206/12174_1 /TAXON_ID=1158023 /ORGANISM="Astrosyne radiata, Strain 13vi08-1A" /LENGTH=225 /DNA_ID=CAMNT_0004474363 /DNA_START=286 /DNA_END=964 /DNA_ORIENTATION=+
MTAAVAPQELSFPFNGVRSKSLPILGFDCDKTLNNGKTAMAFIKRVRFAGTPEVHAIDLDLSKQEKLDYFYSRKELADLYREAFDCAKSHNVSTDGLETQDDNTFRGLENFSNEGTLRVRKNVKCAVGVVLTAQRHAAQFGRNHKNGMVKFDKEDRIAHGYAEKCKKSYEAALERGRKDRDIALGEYKKERQILSGSMLIAPNADGEEDYDTVHVYRKESEKMFP